MTENMMENPSQRRREGANQGKTECDTSLVLTATMRGRRTCVGRQQLDYFESRMICGFFVISMSGNTDTGEGRQITPFSEADPSSSIDVSMGNYE
ncbi:hypothetical protein [Paenibacillus sp. GM2FR]|uniref:hypothetical protein n=1 Tax=Paenibacillus sp. GM2FR TaxID=2059268 RepID=UPI001054BC8C|nr:hypothetical protein [Paenibacillus sp. GM2FR]